MPMRRPVAFALSAAFAIGACTGSPQQSPTGSPGASVAPSSSSAPPSVTAAASPTVTPSPEPLVIEWTRRAVTGLESTAGIGNLAASDALIVANASIRDGDDFRWQMWHSTDGLSWTEASRQDDNQDASDIAVGGPGFVAVGAAGDDVGVWLSSDGDAWERVHDDSLAHGSAETLLVTESGLIAFGDRTDDPDQRMIWTSEDGREWLAATNESGRQVASGLLAATDYDGRAVAFVQAEANEPITVWETTGRAEWDQVGALPDSANTVVDQAAGGPRGWVAIGSANESGASTAWASDDGRTWRRVGTGPDVSSDLVADDAGFIAVGFVGSLPGETCGDQRPFEMKTWTTVDGDAWTLQPSEDEGIASVLEAVVVDRTLLGVGVDWTKGDVMDGTGAPAAWTAPLPPVAAPASTSDEPTTPETCGP